MSVDGNLVVGVLHALRHVGAGHDYVSVRTDSHWSGVWSLSEVALCIPLVRQCAVQQSVNPRLVLTAAERLLFLVVLQIVVAHVVDALVAEAVDRAQRVVQLHADRISSAVGGCPVRTVDALQDALVHFLQQVRVLCDVEAEVCRELANLYELPGIEVQLPTVVGHTSYVCIRNC